MILSEIHEHRLCPSLMLLLIAFSCCGYKLEAFVTTLYQALSQRKRARSGVTDSAISQHVTSV
jgi:hypothetical protein